MYDMGLFRTIILKILLTIIIIISTILIIYGFMQVYSILTTGKQLPGTDDSPPHISRIIR